MFETFVDPIDLVILTFDFSIPKPKVAWCGLGQPVALTWFGVQLSRGHNAHEHANGIDRHTHAVTNVAGLKNSREQINILQ